MGKNQKDKKEGKQENKAAAPSQGRKLQEKEIEEKEKKGSGKNDSTEKVVEKLEALSVQEGEQPQDAAPAAVEEEQ